MSPPFRGLSTAWMYRSQHECLGRASLWRMRSLAVLCALFAALPAKADTFWFAEPSSTPEAADNAVRDCLRGVLVSEDAANYVVRVVGGEMTIAKSSVVRIEKDDLTVEAIAKSEAEAKDALAAADAARTQRQAESKLLREVAVAEASARKAEASPIAVLPPLPAAAPSMGFARAGLSKRDLLREASMTYRETRDRELLRVIRQLRRL